jgi:GT2 family glycosyltransferase
VTFSGAVGTNLATVADEASEPPEPGSVTVAISTCGRPEALARCLDALAAGTVSPGEVIVVDQAPLPETQAVIAVRRPLRVRYFKQARLGVSASRNLALANAKGRIHAVTDDDCVPDPDWVHELLTAFSRPPFPEAVTGRILALGPPPSGGYAVSLRESQRAADHSGRRVPWHVGSGGNFAARTEVLRKKGGWDERLGPGSSGRAAEDAELLYRLLSAGLTVRYAPAAVVRHEWQTRARRLATRDSYGYGTGAMLGILIRRRDLFAVRLLADYLWLQVRGLLSAMRRRDRFRYNGHARAIASVIPGAVYGIRAGPRASGREADPAKAS